MRLYHLTCLVLTAALAGCTIPTQNYRPSVDNAQSLRHLPRESLRVAAFTAKDGNEATVNDISMRGSTLTSPYGSFAAYVEAALRQELADAGKLNPASEVSVTGVLLQNKIDANGVSTGTADLQVQFTVSNGSKVTYQKVHQAHHEWPSSFAGAVAIPAATQNYPTAVQKLLASLFADREFISAVKGEK